MRSFLGVVCQIVDSLVVYAPGLLRKERNTAVHQITERPRHVNVPVQRQHKLGFRLFDHHSVIGVRSAVAALRAILRHRAVWIVHPDNVELFVLQNSQIKRGQSCMVVSHADTATRCGRRATEGLGSLGARLGEPDVWEMAAAARPKARKPGAVFSRKFRRLGLAKSSTRSEVFLIFIFLFLMRPCLTRNTITIAPGPQARRSRCRIGV